MNTFQKGSFYLFGFLCLVVGVLLLLAPGRFLGTIQWAPVDPLISRMLGAALIGMSWGAWRAVRSENTKLASSLVEIFLIFTLLSSSGILRHLVKTHWPLMVWGLFIFLALFALDWILILFQLRKVPASNEAQ